MAVEESAELGVDGDIADAEGGGQVVGLEFALEATLELEQRRVLNVTRSGTASVKACSGTLGSAADREGGRRHARDYRLSGRWFEGSRPEGSGPHRA